MGNNHITRLRESLLIMQIWPEGDGSQGWVFGGREH